MVKKRINNQGNRKRNDVEDLEPANAKTQRGQRGKKQGGTNLNGGLACGCNPGMSTIGKVPLAQLVQEQHPKGSKEEPQKPEQGTGVPEAQVEMAECRQQERSQDQRRNLIVIGHGSRGSPSALIRENPWLQ